MTKQNHYCYKIILEGSDLFYTGRRSTIKDIDKDIYFGSGKWVKGIKDHSRLTKIILGVYDTKEELFAAEQAFIDEYFDDPNCMNYVRSSCGAAPGIHHHNYGRTGELNPFYGKTHSEEFRKKHSEYMKGKYVGENHPNYGKTFSEEHRQKMSDAWKNRTPMSDETRQKMSVSSKGKPKSEEHCKNISVSKRGKYTGENSSRAKLKEPQVREIIKLYENGGNTHRGLAIKFGVDKKTIGTILRKETWKHI